jgi:asparagine synthase (glutamine-hydrolysing)
MCGICGIISFEQAKQYEPNVRAMNEALSHRGPDAEGYWSNNHIVLGHKRLSIIDLSASGNQPMISNDKRYILVFNGEIYNFREIREELTDYIFHTHSDTEVLLAAYSKWGANCITRFNGMFAFAIWDNLKNELFVVRDRIGIKPLYYRVEGDKLIFSSEIRSLLASNLIPRKIDETSLVDYMRYQTVHAPGTIVQDVKMLMPGQFLSIQSPKLRVPDHNSPDHNFPNSQSLVPVLSSACHTIHSGYYWQLGKSNTLSQSPAGKSKKEIRNNIRELLSQAVERRLIADVPFGAFLSGGLDSSVIVGLMASVLNKPVNTFSVTFEEKKYSESPYSRLIAKRFNTNHTEIQLTPNGFLNMLPGALASMDHPSGDGPNTWVVSKVTKEAGITMALSGLGGDELFAGYDVFKRLDSLYQFRSITRLPVKFRSLPGYLLNLGRPSVSKFKINELLSLQNWELTNTYPLSRQVLPDHKINQLIISSGLPANEVETIVRDQTSFKKSTHFLSLISCAEISTYMQNILLRDTDQMSMAHSLEVRVPFMDYLLVEYMLQVPDDIKYPRTPKQLLAESMQDLLPKNFAQRRKMGFTLPWDSWMHYELKTFCEYRIRSLSKYDFFNSYGLMHIWQRFLNHDPLITWSRIWALVALSDWLESNGIN